MAEDEEELDPMDPESWYEEIEICGGCIAWKPDNPREGEQVAAGSCRLRPELSRVPATMAKCSLFKQRGAFTYEPGRETTRRKRSKVLSILRVRADGTEVRSKVRSEKAAGPREEAPQRPPPPKDIDLGELASLPVVRQALVELVRTELGRSRREIHPKFKGGTVVAKNSAGVLPSVPAERLFAFLDKLQSSLDALEKQIEKRRPALGKEEADELIDGIKKARGTFTTFNILFGHREDWFSSK